MIKYAKKCMGLLKDKEITSRLVWANNHYEKYNEEYICMVYTIPIVEIENIGDIGFNIDKCFYEGYFKKEQLLHFNLKLLKFLDEYVLYGESDYLNDIYNSQMLDKDIKQAIIDAKDHTIAIGFDFSYKDLEKTIELLIHLTK